MPSIKDESTVNKIAEVFCGEGKRCKAETLRIVGYKPSYCNNHGTGIVYTNNRVIKAIAAIDAKTSKKCEYNRDINISTLLSDHARLLEAANSGNVQAIQARTAISRELNASTGQHSTTLHTDDATGTEHKTGKDEIAFLEARLKRLKRMASLPDAIERAV